MNEADTFAPDLAVELIDEFGTAGKATVPADRDFDVAEGEACELGPSEVDIVITPPQRYKKDFFDGDVKLAEVSYSFIKGNVAFTPTRGMRVTVSGRNWAVVRVDPLISGVQTAAYRLFLTA